MIDSFFLPRSTTDAIFMRQLQEKFSENKKELNHVVIDLEKAFNQVPRKATEWALRRQKVPEKLLTAVMSLYAESRARVQTVAETE